MAELKWNHNSVLHWIIQRHSNGEFVRAKEAFAYNHSMYYAGVRAFGSWAGALSAAGINPPLHKGASTWSPKKILNAIQCASAKPKSLCYSNMRKRRQALLGAAEKYFGSWRNALIAADIDPLSTRLIRRWDRESVIEAILDRAVKNEPLAASKVSPRSLGDWGVKIFGSWPDALLAAGLDPDQYVRFQSTAVSKNNCSRKWSRALIASELRHHVREGKSINMSRLKVENGSLYSAIRRYFEDWDAAIMYAGMNPQKFRQY